MCDPPWRERCKDLVGRLRLPFRQRCVILALIAAADRRGRCLLGNLRLAEVASVIGARLLGGGRRAKPLDRSYLCRVLFALRLRGLVSTAWFPAAAGYWVRVLRLREDALRACVEWGFARGRAWDSRRDTPPAVVADRVARSGASAERTIRRVKTRLRIAAGEHLPVVGMRRATTTRM